MEAAPNRTDILIVGGGCAGITLAAQLRKHTPQLSVAIADPADKHWYQPGFTFVGSGVFTRAQTERNEADLIPAGVNWIKKAVATFEPEADQVTFADGATMTYGNLVVCPGLKLDWDRIEGLRETIGKNGVCSNYLPDYAEYTWECVQKLDGGTALFTQPAMPIKCAGAPQKILYLTADHLRKKGRLDKVDIEFCLAGEALFGVAAFVPPLQKAMDGYGAHVNYRHNLKAVDGAQKKAIFDVVGSDGSTSEVVKDFTMLHVTPPQTAPDFIRSSPLASEAGWVEVDGGTLQHKKFPRIFSLGDAAGTTNAKTAAAVRKQVPVVRQNIMAQRAGKPLTETYDGYGSCPLTVAYGKIVLAEFIYGGKVTPSFPLDPRVPRWSMWQMKEKLLPWLYWSHMFHGGEIDLPHRERTLA